jgi:DNA-binding YbaB/EbfC family protein
VFNHLGNLADLMHNAGKIRENVEKATEALGKLQVEGTAGGGSVKATVNGKMELLSIRIDPKLLADGDAELLEDLVAAAVNQGLTRARESAGESMSKMAGDFPLPPGLANMFGPGPGGRGG